MRLMAEGKRKVEVDGRKKVGLWMRKEEENANQRERNRWKGR